MLKQLCRRYTDLTEEDITKLEQIAAMLPYFCQLSGADIFIDCMLREEKKGVVVAHGQPGAYSQYEKNITGAMVLPENEPIVFFTGETGVSMRDAKGISQENKTVMQKTTPVYNDRGRIIGILIEETDVTGSMKQAQKLDEMGRTTAQLTETLLDLRGGDNVITQHINAGIVVFDRDMTVNYVNPYAQKLYRELGYPELLTGLPLDQVCLVDGTHLQQLIEGGIERCETAAAGKNLVVRFQRGERGEGLIMNLEDVSELKQKEQQLVEKSAMIREMHHRIKNNLQMVSSILSMQQRRSCCGETKEVLAENISRINSIASVHELLIEAEEQEADLWALLEKLISSMKNYACSEDKQLDIHLLGDRLYVDSDQALAIVLITNELVTNAVQHGYEERQQGLVEVIVTSGMTYSSVAVRDGGRGFDPEAKQEGHLGLDLIRLLVEDKLKGQLQIQSSPGRGTIAKFDFQ